MDLTKDELLVRYKKIKLADQKKKTEKLLETRRKISDKLDELKLNKLFEI